MSRLRRVKRLSTLDEVAAEGAYEMNQPLAAIAMAAENGLWMVESGAAPNRLAGKPTRSVARAGRLGQITDAIRPPARDAIRSPGRLQRDQMRITVPGRAGGSPAGVIDQIIAMGAAP